MRFRAPPDWPPPPEGWSPRPGWEPPAAWGPPPKGWVFWVDDRSRAHRAVTTAGIVVAQLLVANILGGTIPFFLGVGGGWELVAIPLGMTLAVWGVGLAGVPRPGPARRPALRLAGTAAGSAVGVVLILLTPPFGYAQLALPLLGALLGFHLGPGSRVRRDVV